MYIQKHKVMEVLEKLRDDNHYYGEFGQKYLSNSVIKTLLENPKAFGQEVEKTKAMIEGSYLHTLLLEPEKADEFVVVDASTRNTKVYKEALAESSQEILLLQKEADEMRECADALTSNMEIYDIIRDSSNVYEEPAIKEIFGNLWKSKRDIGNSAMTIDIKTTSDIQKFKRSAWMYNYDSQAWIYEQQWGVPMVFIVVDKITKQVGIFTCSDDFLQRGKEKVIRATQVYNKYFHPDSDGDIDEFIIKDVL
jgi:hypothetical protein